MTPAQRRECVIRYVAGEKPAAIAEALTLEVAEVEAAVRGGGKGAAPAPVVRAKRSRKAAADAPAPTSAADKFDPADPAKRNGVPHGASHGYGYATVRGGGRRVY